jgi:hypothetical protein
MKSYCTINVVDEATTNFPSFILTIADSASLKGAFTGLSSGTWIDGFYIERQPYKNAISYYSD